MRARLEQTKKLSISRSRSGASILSLEFLLLGIESNGIMHIPVQHTVVLFLLLVFYQELWFSAFSGFPHLPGCSGYV